MESLFVDYFNLFHGMDIEKEFKDGEEIAYFVYNGNKYLIPENFLRRIDMGSIVECKPV